MKITENRIISGGISFPNPIHIKTKGRWIKYKGNWEVGLDEVFDDKNIIIEEEKTIGGELEPQENRYAIVESRNGQKTIVKLAEFETTLRKFGTCHVYSFTVSAEI